MRVTPYGIAIMAIVLACNQAASDSFTRLRTENSFTASPTLGVRTVRNAAKPYAPGSEEPQRTRVRTGGTGSNEPSIEYRSPPEDFWKNQDTSSDSELDLYEIYNLLYHTNISNADLDSSALRVDWEQFAAGPLVQSISFQAVWHDAHMQQRFGIYTTDSEGYPDYTELFSYGTMLNDGTIGPSGDIRDIGITATIDAPDDPIGFYLESLYWDDEQWKNPAWGYMHSEALRNYYDGSDYEEGDEGYKTWPNMFYEVHFIILRTPDPNVFLLAIEDLPYGHQDSHWDYNDFLVEMRLNIVPEPATLSLLGIGLFGLLGVRWKSGRKKV